MRTQTVIDRLAQGNVSAFTIAEKKLESDAVCDLNKNKLRAALELHADKDPRVADTAGEVAASQVVPVATQAAALPETLKQLDVTGVTAARKTIDQPTGEQILRGVDLLAKAVAETKFAALAAERGVKVTTFARTPKHKEAREAAIAAEVNSLRSALVSLAETVAI